MRVSRTLHASLLTIGIALSLSHGLRAQQAADTVVRVGDNDLGGTITSANGPEAGVWVIAETTDLPTKLAKIVGHRRSRALPHSRSSKSQLQRVGSWIRPGRLGQGPERAGQDARPQSCGRADFRCGGGVLSGRLLVFDAEGSGQKPISRHRCRRQRHAGNPEEPGAMAGHRQDQRLLHLSCTRQQGDPYDPKGVRPL